MVIPSSVTKMSGSMFYYCRSLEEAVIRANITTMQSSMFYNCVSLKKVSLPSSLMTITTRVFDTCGIEEVTIPASVYTIYSNVFNSANQLRKVTFENTEGWVLATSYYATTGDPVDVTDPEVNATNLTSTYKTKYYRRLS